MSAFGNFLAKTGGAFNTITGVTGQNEANAQQAAAAQNFSANEAEKNRLWQAGQSATAHQREVADLRAAGLNPILSGTGGMGAQTGGGATGQGFQARMERADPVEAISSALAVNRQRYEIQNLKAQAKNLSADTDKKMSERALNSVLYNRTLEETDRERHLKNIDAERLKGAKVEGEIDSGRYGAALRYIDRALPAAGAATSAFSASRYLRR